MRRPLIPTRSFQQIVVSALALLFLVSALHLSVKAAGTAWKVLFNGQPSQAQVLETEGRAYLPVTFPLDPGETTFEVTVKVDATGKSVQVLRTTKKAPRREKEDCWFCQGDGDCRSCYPKGSGRNTDGQPCIACNGTGKCDYCGGSGYKP